MMSEARQRIAAQQAELVRALVAGGAVPAGFAHDRIAAAARSLIHKRRQAAARAWPSIVAALGERFVERFTAYATSQPLPASASPLADGRAFLGWMEKQEPLPDALRIEALTFDLRYVETPAGLRMRRGFLVKLARLEETPCRVIAVRVPWLGEHWFRLPRWGAK